ncbi:hypothetical protein Kpol_489p7 [Vanderwaltozyma polyspora DSM 70294]|uniref:Eukaryotic translation initiation factor 3 subunit J n=1 Tax=Vanderwaltozyma polyspora (strain ATCC 22028 / DSM 70294 / BCRC 21397 / CBS 2163 / NBRC 10782 / NRRL Y-8283 / UCD 57-17) TaxID=436907 RepID=EIF3J_VANPO|nr:uncharacterized protein Kpol_489p7 [Vanderwaltozyma polyspora DSM 70294]A7TQ21.1 RecName: Full=Eukaryotic translation initiation factor 3 subunit J; Short=eIF3j; AltName: Full=Eukaryotic translation initiation factor 3 30 kDa subunit; Short=eIF-3 30 kDa [Vanderwaltozyma polyspora DSM 70294]EDO15626.1 hypothetical protein Kpol_489p7 [Vanderwaltozyma polyspora DSM 70294]
MSWNDDDVFAGSANNDDVVLMDSWDAEEPIMESWDAEETPAKKETSPKPDSKKNAKKDSKKDKKSSTDQVLLEIDVLDEKTRKELLKKAELESDLNNAAELFGSLGVAEEHPRARALRKEQEVADAMRPAAFTKDTPIESHPLFNGESKKDYQDLRKALATAIVTMNEKSSLNYSSSLAIDLIRDVAKPMSIESIRQSIATLNVLMKDKEREERRARLAKVKGGTATGGAGKKKAKAKTNLGGAFKKDQEFDMGVDTYEDFGDDDFM